VLQLGSGGDGVRRGCSYAVATLVPRVPQVTEAACLDQRVRRPVAGAHASHRVPARKARLNDDDALGRRTRVSTSDDAPLNVGAFIELSLLHVQNSLQVS
jgi:hypothetical protein